MCTKDTATHNPVLLDEVIEALDLKADGIYVDGTFGRGGHSSALLRELGSGGRLLMVDRDSQAIATAEALFGDDARCVIRRGAFSGLAAIVEQLGWTGKVNGILLDLGVSSPQLDQAERGFSFMQEGPLDMRMDPDQEVSAQVWLNSVTEAELIRALRDYGEEKQAVRIARQIIAQRVIQPLTTTHELANLVSQIVRNPRLKKHPATRTFQAIRIAVNNELGELRDFLDQVIEILAPGGRLAIISFHSLEDRIVKRFMRDQSEANRDLPPGIPIISSELEPLLRRVSKAIQAGDEELAKNPRSRSAVLRVVEKRA